MCFFFPPFTLLWQFFSFSTPSHSARLKKMNGLLNGHHIFHTHSGVVCFSDVAPTAHICCLKCICYIAVHRSFVRSFRFVARPGRRKTHSLRHRCCCRHLFSPHSAVRAGSQTHIHTAPRTMAPAIYIVQASNNGKQIGWRTACVRECVRVCDFWIFFCRSWCCDRNWWFIYFLFPLEIIWPVSYVEITWVTALPIWSFLF